MSLQVFISYKRKYEDFAREVKAQIHEWGYGTWFDMDDIPEGTYFRHAIQKGLEGSDVMVGVLTEEAIQSREVQAEWDYFFIKNKHFIPLRYQEVEPPYHLLTIQYIDFLENRALAFEKLKNRLMELAAVQPPSAAPAPAPHAIEQKPEPPPADVGAGLKPAPTEAQTTITDAKKRDEATSTGEYGAVSEEAESLHDQFGEIDDKETSTAVGTAFLPSAPPPAAPQREPPKPAPIIAPITAPVPMPQQAASPTQIGGLPPGASLPIYSLYEQPAAPKRSRVRPLLWALGSVAALLVAVVGAVMVFSSSNSLPTIITQPQTVSPVLLALGAVVIGTVAVFGYRRWGRTDARTDAQTDAANRRIMLDKVEEFWIRGVLDKALEAGQFEMGLAAAPGAVLRHVDYGDYPLPPNANIAQIFEDLNRELLILGAPGGGKTVLLLQLARELIIQARNPTPTSQPPRVQGGAVMPAIPVVFNLSSWAAERKSLADWLVDEIRRQYQFSKKVAQTWVEREQILPLLDGLDEVAEQYRNDCVEAINTFRQLYRAVDMAVCSRLADYDPLTSKLDVRGAVTLRLLDDDQINRYLDRSDLDGLRQVMRGDAELRDMTHTPFLLNSMAYAYAGASVNSLQVPRSDDMGKARRTHLFDRLVEKRLATNSHEKYTARQTRKWLGWLAGKMLETKDSEFKRIYLESYWLSLEYQKYFHRLWNMFVPCSILILFALNGILGWLSDQRPSFLIGFGLAISLNLSILIIGGLRFEITIQNNDDDPEKHQATEGASNRRIIERSVNTLRLIEALIGSSSRIGFLIILVPSNVVFLFSGVTEGWLYGAIGSLIFASLIEMAIVSLIRSEGSYFLSADTSKFHKESWLKKNIITFFLTQWVRSFIGLFTVVFFYHSINYVLRHLLTRILLWRSGDAPLNYARFLDYCASAGLLRKVGGGYIFVHRYLLEYFAESGG